MRTILSLSGAFAIALALGLSPVHAQQKSASASDISPSVAELQKRYPAGSINSDDMASDALADIKKERSNADARLKDARIECAKKFLVTKCRDEAKEQRRRDRAQLKLIENEAARYKRQQKVIRRDEALADKRAKEEGNADKRAKNLERYEKQTSERAERGGSGPGLSGKPPLTPEERAANVEAYEKKLDDFESNKRKVAERKAKNDKKRERKRAANEREKEKKAKAAEAAAAKEQ